MEKFIPYEKLSKKQKRKMDLAKRQTWGELNPVTRKPVSSKAYNRKKSQGWKRELPPGACDFFLDFSGLSPYNRIRIWNCHRVVMRKASVYTSLGLRRCVDGCFFLFWRVYEAADHLFFKRGTGPMGQFRRTDPSILFPL